MLEVSIVKVAYCMDIDVAAYKSLYLQTAKENLAGIIAGITVLEKNPQDTNAIESVFIKSHSLKGQSMTMGYTGIAKTALAIERYMRSIRDEHRVISWEVLQVLRIGAEKIGESIASVEEKSEEKSMSEVITALEQRLGVKV